MPRRVFCFFIVFVAHLYAGWNDDFDSSTEKLVAELSDLSNSGYLDSYECFVDVRRSLLKNASLKNRMKNAFYDDKFIVDNPVYGCILKKRKYDNIKECFVWEVSHFLNASQFFVPSFAIDIGGRKSIVQRKESFIIGEDSSYSHPKNFIEMVSLIDFWKSHLVLYILGGKDLVARNIGINSRGELRFFDMENSFVYSFKKEMINTRVQFAMHSFDWPQYRRPLDEIEAKELEGFIGSWRGFEKKISLYMKYRPTHFSIERMFQRLAKVRSFSLEKGKSFCDFYGFLFPERALALEELNQIVSEIKGVEVDHGTALCLISSKSELARLSLSHRNALEKWANKNLK